MKLNKFEEAYLKIINECNNKHIIKENSSDGDFEAGKYYKGSCYLNYPNCEEELNYYENVLSEISSINNKGIQVHFGEYESSPFGGQMKVTLFWKGDNFIGKTFSDVFNSAGSFGNDINDWYEDSENEIDGEITKEEYNTLFKNRLTSTKFKKWLKDVEKEINEDDFDIYKGNKIRSLAINPSTSKETLLKLSNNEDEWVRCAVAENPNCPKEILIKLANDEHLNIRCAVVRHPNTPEEVLIKFAADTDSENLCVRNRLAENPNISLKVGLKLIHNQASFISQAHQTLAENPNCPKEFLIELAKCEYYAIREAVAENPNTPKEILIKLANDKNEWVRKKAQMTLNKNK